MGDEKKSRRYLRGAPAERFWACVDKTESCWLWNGNRKPNGYGSFSIKGRLVYAHRFAYMSHNDVPLSKRQEVAHICDNPPCVRPDHLFLATHKENMADMARKCRSGQTKLTPLMAKAIRELYRRNGATFNQTNLADMFGVHRSIVSDIVLGKTWREII